MRQKAGAFSDTAFDLIHCVRLQCTDVCVSCDFCDMHTCKVESCAPSAHWQTTSPRWAADTFVVEVWKEGGLTFSHHRMLKILPHSTLCYTPNQKNEPLISWYSHICGNRSIKYALGQYFHIVQSSERAALLLFCIVRLMEEAHRSINKRWVTVFFNLSEADCLDLTSQTVCVVTLMERWHALVRLLWWGFSTGLRNKPVSCNS